jgi:ABC-2 type transport system permease protein
VSAFGKITLMEARLFLRESGVVVTALLFPTALLLVVGFIPTVRTPSPTFGGARFVDVFAPSLVVLVLGFLSLNRVPTAMGRYRERGVLRRMSTTPVHPAKLVAAQLVVNLVAGVLAVGLLVAVGSLAFDIDLPHHLPGFAAAFLVGLSSLSAVGLLIAAVSPSARSATGIAGTLLLVIMLLGGVDLPRFLLPHFLVLVGTYTPPGVQALQDAWMGAGPQPLHLAIMAAITVVVGALAVRAFRWE